MDYGRADIGWEIFQCEYQGYWWYTDCHGYKIYSPFYLFSRYPLGEFSNAQSLHTSSFFIEFSLDTREWDLEPLNFICMAQNPKKSS